MIANVQSDFVLTSPLLGELSLVNDPRFSLLGSSMGTDFGNPVPVEQTIPSLLLDGSLVVKTGDDNRSSVFFVAVWGASSSQLQSNGEALVQHLSSSIAGTYHPMDGVGEPTVYDVVSASAKFTTSDVYERNLIAVYEVDLTCAPYVHAVDPITVDAPAESTGNLVVIGDGTSAAGWSSNVTAIGGQFNGRAAAVYSASTGSTGVNAGFTVTMASTDFTTTPYVAWDLSKYYELSIGGGPYWMQNGSVLLYVNGVLVGEPTTALALSSGSTRYVWNIGSFAGVDAVTTLTFTRNFSFPGSYPGTATLHFDNVTRSGQMPVATPFQRSFAVPVVGSVRTPVSLRIAGGGTTPANLGSIIAYTSPVLGQGGYVPSLAQWATESRTTSTSKVSGATSATLTCPVPVATLPRGAYVLVAKVDSISAGGSITWSTSSKDPSGNVVGLRSGTMTPTGAGIWGLASLILPETPIDNPDPTAATGGAVTVKLTGASGTTVVFDEAWLFWMGDPLTGIEDGALTIIQPSALGGSSGVPSYPYAWLDSATLANGGKPAVWVGGNADGSNRRHAGAYTTSWGQHQFLSGVTSVFTVVTQISGSTPVPQAVSATYYPTFHSRVARVAS